MEICAGGQYFTGALEVVRCPPVLLDKQQFSNGLAAICLYYQIVESVGQGFSPFVGQLHRHRF